MFIYGIGNGLGMKKRGMESSTPGMGTVVAVVLLLALLGVGLYQLYKGQTTVGTAYNKLAVQAEIGACKTSAMTATGFRDDDFGPNAGDSFPDICDTCLGGDDGIDADLDGIPNACDDDPNKAPAKKSMEDICRDAGKRVRATGQYAKESKQCTLVGLYAKPHPRI